VSELTPEEADLLASWAAAEAEFSSALESFNESNVADPPDPHWQLKRDRLDNAMRVMRDLRKFWRSVGESLPQEHPGSRSFVKVSG